MYNEQSTKSHTTENDYCISREMILSQTGKSELQNRKDTYTQYEFNYSTIDAENN